MNEWYGSYVSSQLRRKNFLCHPVGGKTWVDWYLHTLWNTFVCTICITYKNVNEILTAVDDCTCTCRPRSGWGYVWSIEEYCGRLEYNMCNHKWIFQLNDLSVGVSRWWIDLLHTIYDRRNTEKENSFIRSFCNFSQWGYFTIVFKISKRQSFIEVTMFSFHQWCWRMNIQHVLFTATLDLILRTACQWHSLDCSLTVKRHHALFEVNTHKGALTQKT